MHGPLNVKENHD